MDRITGAGAGVLLNGVRRAGGLGAFVVTGLRETATVPLRTGAFLADSSCRRLRGARTAHLPAPRLSLGLALHAGVDRWIVALHQPSLPHVPPSEVERVAREMRDANLLYSTRGWLADPASYHGVPPALESPEISWQRARTVTYERLSFESGYEPHDGEPGRRRWLRARPNGTARAWMLRHDSPRPWVVLIHGSGMGYPWLDAVALRAIWLHRELGLNVMLPVLPKHGARKNAGAFAIPFPTDDVLDNIHGLAQSVWEVRRLISWIRARDDGPVGVAGVSLGGYVAALTAALEQGLACVVASVPISDFPLLFTRGLPAGRSRLAPEHLELAQKLHTVASPLAMSPRVARDRRFIVGGLADGMADPSQQVLPLWHHWGRPATLWYEGGHLGYLCTSAAIHFLRDAIERSGLAPAPTRGS